MTRNGLRALLCTTASGLGLWAVASGFLTHHPIAMKIGAGVALVGALLVFTGPADARPVLPEPDEHWLASSVPYEARFVEFASLGSACRNDALNERLLGCAMRPPLGKCEIVVPTQKSWPGSPEAWAANFLHELAHCARWPANHPEETAR